MVNPKNSYELPESFLYIDLESVKQGILIKKEIIVKETAPSRAQRCLIINEILYSCVRPYQHNNYIFKMNEKVVASTGFAVLRGQPSSTFLYSLIDSKNFESKVINRCTGTSYPSINSSNLASIVINVPSKEEQIKIGNFLDIINARIECQNKIINHYESLIKTIIDSKIYSFNNERETLKTYASLRNGYAFKSENYNENGQYKIVTIGNVTGDQYISDNTNNIDKIPFDIQRHQILKKNDILVSLTGNVGRVSMVNSDNCLLNQRVGLIQINNIEFRNYIYVVLSSHIFEREMVNKSQGAAQLNIGKNDVENYKMPKPTKTNLEISELIYKYLTKLSIEKRILKLFQDEKKYLLSNLFI